MKSGGVLVQSQTVRTARAENIQHLYDATGTWQGNRRTILMGRMPGSGVTQEGGTFEGGFGDRSMFNKEKWLPMARDLPVLISHKCCSVMKKAPIRKYQRENKLKPFIGMLAEESRSRQQSWIRTGCNAFDSKEPSSNPLSFWREQDILQYIKNMSLPIASVYGDVVYTDGEFEYNATPIGGSFKLKCTGCDRTGCIFCAFGAHLEKGETRFERLKITHPKQYDYCMRGGEWSDNPYYDPEAPEYDGEWKNWNPQKIWTPGNGGLGMAKVFDMANELYPNTWRY